MPRNAEGHACRDLALFLPQIEIHGLSLVGAEQALLVDASRDRLKLGKDTPLSLPLLDISFLEPERSRITEVPITETGLAMLDGRETLAVDRLFSAAELRNDILAMEATYAECPSSEHLAQLAA